MKNTSSDELKLGVVKATWTPLDLAQALVDAHPEWQGQHMDIRLLGQALREAFVMLRRQVDGVDEGTVAVPSLGRFHARRPPKKPELRRVLFQATKDVQAVAQTASTAEHSGDPASGPEAVPEAVVPQAMASDPVEEAPPLSVKATRSKSTTKKSRNSDQRK